MIPPLRRGKNHDQCTLSLISVFVIVSLIFLFIPPRKRHLIFDLFVLERDGLSADTGYGPVKLEQGGIVIPPAICAPDRHKSIIRQREAGKWVPVTFRHGEK